MKQKGMMAELKMSFNLDCQFDCWKIWNTFMGFVKLLKMSGGFGREN